MEVVYERCAGLDVHRDTVVASVITPAGRELRTFGTVTDELLALADWLLALGVTHVAMESTGVYWKPIYNLLESTGLELLVVNARHIKAVPGRKTDVRDAEWIADLLRHGLLRGSFIPDRGQRELRELVRYRRRLIEERAREAERLHKTLEGANVKLGAVASNILGASGRAMLTALVEGRDDPEVLAALAKGRLRNKHDRLVAALRGLIGPHQRHLLATQLRHIDFLDAEIVGLSSEIEERMRPFAAALALADSIPGVGQRTAEGILAEIGTDMTRFPTSAHLASWARMCPGTDESAGKRKSGATGAGNVWLRAALVEAAHAAARTKGTYLAAQYRRIAARRGAKRAAVAVGHSILVALHQMLSTGAMYEDLGATWFDERDRRAIVRRSVQRLEGLGYKVTLETAA
jgi:transposase